MEPNKLKGILNEKVKDSMTLPPHSQVKFHSPPIESVNTLTNFSLILPNLAVFEAERLYQCVCEGRF